MTTKYMIERSIPNHSGIKNHTYVTKNHHKKYKRVIDEMHEIFLNYLQFNFRLSLVSLVQSAIITLRP